MRKERRVILLLFPKVLLQFSKSGNCRGFYLQNAKPQFLFLGFGLG